MSLNDKDGAKIEKAPCGRWSGGVRIRGKEVWWCCGGAEVLRSQEAVKSGCDRETREEGEGE